MSSQYRVVAINGSPHEGFGNTSQMLAMLREGPAARPDVIIRTPADVWLAICKGELNGAMAYMKGKYKVEGKVSLLMKLDSLFGK
jgi:putative sterol carrier protein